MKRDRFITSLKFKFSNGFQKFEIIEVVLKLNKFLEGYTVLKFKKLLIIAFNDGFEIFNSSRGKIQ